MAQKKILHDQEHIKNEQLNIIDKIVIMKDNITVAYKINLTHLCDAEILIPLEQRGAQSRIAAVRLR